jgi:hypothetical protein
MLNARIDRVVSQGLLTAKIAMRLKEENQAHEPNRAGRVWFCFFPPGSAGEGGINRFFRLWGGEALYNSHEEHAVNARALRAIGTPCIVEAEVPISSLGGNNHGLTFKVVRRYLIYRGYYTSEPCDHEDRIILPLPAACIRHVHRFPDLRFLALSGCSDWRELLET